MKKIIVFLSLLIIAMFLVGCGEITADGDDASSPPSLPEDVEETEESFTDDLPKGDLQPPTLPEE